VARAPAGMRTYRISRMQDAVVLAVTFERPANFDLAAHWKTATAQLQQKREQFRATLALAPDAAVVLRRWCRVSPTPELQHTPAIPDKWTVLHVFFESQEEARFVALGFGSRAHVLAPFTLRDEVMQEMNAAVARPPIAVSPS
jgi:predicted DNA-binding transcriptional regulator YafY